MKVGIYNNFSFVSCFLQTNTSALSDVIDPSERKVSEFPTVGKIAGKSDGACSYIPQRQQCDRLGVGALTVSVILLSLGLNLNLKQCCAIFPHGIESAAVRREGGTLFQRGIVRGKNKNL